MPLPGNLTQRTVEGWFVDFSGNAIAGQISFSLPESLIDASAGTIIVESSETATLDSNGQFTVSIPITNDGDISPASFQYTVRELFTGGRTYSISLPSGATVDIATLAPIGTYTAFYPLASAYLWNEAVDRLVVQEGLYDATGYIVAPPGYTGSLPITAATFPPIEPTAAANASAAIASNVGAQQSLTAAQNYENEALGYPLTIMLIGV